MNVTKRSIFSSGFLYFDALFSRRMGIVDRALRISNDPFFSDNGAKSLSFNLSCHIFRELVERALSELDFLKDKHNSDLAYLDLFTHIVRGYNNNPDNSLLAFKDIFSIGNITKLLSSPELWIAKSDAYLESIGSPIDRFASKSLRLGLSRLMGDGRSAILCTTDESSGPKRFMFIFHKIEDVRSDYIAYVEAAFHVKVVN